MMTACCLLTSISHTDFSHIADYGLHTGQKSRSHSAQETHFLFDAAFAPFSLVIDDSGMRVRADDDTTRRHSPPSAQQSTIPPLLSKKT